MDAHTPFVVDDAQVAHNDFGDELVVIHFATGNYYSLRDSAAVLWKHLAQAPASAATLTSLYARPPAEAQQQIAEFLRDLAARNLIVAATGAISLREGSVGDGVHPFQPPQMEIFEDLQALLVADVIHDTGEQGWPNVAPEAAA